MIVDLIMFSDLHIARSVTDPGTWQQAAMNKDDVFSLEICSGVGLINFLQEILNLLVTRLAIFRVPVIRDLSSPDERVTSPRCNKEASGCLY